MARETGYEDIYAAAQFASLTEVVTHATDPTQDREKLYGQASRAMLKAGRWRGYIMQYSPKLHLHVGYRYANPKHWFIGNVDTEEVEGPFRTKRAALSKLRSENSSIVSPGIYAAGDNHIIFTRDRAESVGLTQEELP